MVLTNLARHIDIEFLHEAYRRTRKDGAVGIDRQTAEEYALNLEGNLRSLHRRMRDGSYRAPPVRRVYIPKEKGKTRPIGIPTFEDKVLQRAVAMVLEAVYEQDFLDCSYGFRPQRSAHQALEVVWKTAMDMRGGHVLEVDIRSFFDELDHQCLRGILDQRVRDRGLRRLIGKWLNAGVLEAGALRRLPSGTPQGGVISPLLANIYLHEVLDVWFEREVRPRLGGRSRLIRYADDVVIVFELERDAHRVTRVLPARLGKYGLRVHPEKTRLVNFRRPRRREDDDDDDRPGTFTFLGFTHYWGRSRKGAPTVKQKTSKESFRRSLRAIDRWCRASRHLRIREQHAALTRKVRGHYGYFGITSNMNALKCFVDRVGKLWRRWLDRRSHRAGLNWDRMNILLRRYPLPTPRIVHSALDTQRNLASRSRMR
jgi:group II intron reverse transcriptase/maturase